MLSIKYNVFDTCALTLNQQMSLSVLSGRILPFSGRTFQPDEQDKLQDL
jgi:hypothetical protein